MPHFLGENPCNIYFFPSSTFQAIKDSCNNPFLGDSCCEERQIIVANSSLKLQGSPRGNHNRVSQPQVKALVSRNDLLPPLKNPPVFRKRRYALILPALHSHSKISFSHASPLPGKRESVESSGFLRGFLRALPVRLRRGLSVRVASEGGVRDGLGADGGGGGAQHAEAHTTQFF